MKADMVHGEVKRSFDPKLFEWKRGQEGWEAKTDMKIRISERGQIFLSSAAAKKFKEYAEPSEGGMRFSRTRKRGNSIENILFSEQ